MQSIAEVQRDVISALELSEEGQRRLVQWASAVQGQQVVAQNQDDLLVFVAERIDFVRLARACGEFHRYRGEQGQAARYPIGQLCRALLVKQLYHCSLRKSEQLLSKDSLVRWFVGLRIDERGPDHCTLHRFEQWVKQHQPRLFFDETLRQILEAQPDERQAVQVGDTFALHSRGHEQSRTAMLRQAASKLLGYLGQVSWAGWQAVRTELDWTGLFGAANERPEHFLAKAERDALELRTASAAHTALRLVRQVRAGLGAAAQSRDLCYQALLRWEEVLDKVLHDEFVFSNESEGRVLSVAYPTRQVKGAYRHGSMVDLDATFRIHGDKTVFGYNAHLSATEHFITEIFATTGATPDSSGVAQLIANQKEHQGFVPHKLIYDRAAGLPKIFADVAAASDQQTQLVARLIDHAKRSPRFGPLDFTLGEDGLLTCPNGQTSGRFYRSQEADGWTYRFMPDQCQGCPLMDKCRGDQVKPTAYRQVFISAYRYEQRQALAYLNTAAFKQDMKLRPTVERIIAALVRYNGARQATGYGLANADFQLKMAAMAFNLKRWHALHLAQQKAQRYKPPKEE
jgi:IS5 family transposase